MLYNIFLFFIIFYHKNVFKKYSAQILLAFEALLDTQLVIR